MGAMYHTNIALGAATVFTVVSAVLSLGPAFVGFLFIGLLVFGFILGVSNNG